jgi:radical SAM superfamily enzyme YgiQ (UPF0313 family)
MRKRCEKVLLVNPNRYREPPVIPLGLEYIYHALKSHNFQVSIADLCFLSDPGKELDQQIQRFQPDAVCITIRNVDSVLYPDTDYFLPEVKDYIRRIRNLTAVPIIIGGSALTADPEGILGFVKADLAVVGPGEETLPEILSDGGNLNGKGRIIKGRSPESFCPERGRYISYKSYLERDGLPGFETHKGCSSSCAYCIEAGTAVRFREPADVVCELRQLADQGFRHLHLCDTEFNEDLNYSTVLLQSINAENLGLKWGLYMKVGNYNQRLFDLLKESGAYLVTLTVDSFQRNGNYWSEVASMITECKKNRIRVSIDFLTGFPYESENALKQSLDFFRKAAPDEVVINVVIRLYKNLAITEVIRQDLSLEKHLIRPSGNDDTLLAPQFYNHVHAGRLVELIGGDPLFRIAGAEKGVNYQKA